MAGCKLSNIREVVQKKMEKKGKLCHCIRCREVRKEYDPKEKVYLFREDYKTSNGKEIFLSFENKKGRKLFSFLRLRIPKNNSLETIPVLKNAAIIREIQTYGQLVPISKSKIAPQHKGLGKKLIKTAEKITKKEFNLKKIAVISGVGAREYFKKLGYKLDQTYMIKRV
jgi:elongator complex protein 3